MVRAIALSLADAARNKHEVIDVDVSGSESEDEEEKQLKRAIELSKAEAARTTVSVGEERTTEPVVPSQPAGGFLSER